MIVDRNDPDANKWRVWDCTKHELRIDIGWVDDKLNQYLKLKRWGNNVVIQAHKIVIVREQFVILLNPRESVESLLKYVLSQIGAVK